MSRRLVVSLLTLLVASTLFAPMALAAEADPFSGSDGAGAAAAASLGVVWLICMFFFVVIGIALFVFWILMLVDVIKRDESQFPGSTGNSKVLWLVIVIVLSYIGAIVYYFAVKRKAPLPKAGQAPPPPPPPMQQTPPPPPATPQSPPPPPAE